MIISLLNVCVEARSVSLAFIIFFVFVRTVCCKQKMWEEERKRERQQWKNIIRFLLSSLSQKFLATLENFIAMQPGHAHKPPNPSAIRQILHKTHPKTTISRPTFVAFPPVSLPLPAHLIIITLGLLSQHTEFLGSSLFDTSLTTMNPAYFVPAAYNQSIPGSASPPWLNKGDNSWQLVSGAFVSMQSVPGLVILYGSIVKKKWAVNSAFMALYAFAAVLICWVSWGYRMSFGSKLLPFWGKAGAALGQDYLLSQTRLLATTMYSKDHTTIEMPMQTPWFPTATMVYFQFGFAALTLIVIAGSLLGRMRFFAWMAFVPLWLTFSYTIGAFSLWGGGFLFHWGVIDYSGGYVVHLSSGVAGFVAAYWVGPRMTKDRERFPPNNVILMLAGAGLLWLGWTGFNGGDPYAANIDASIAVLNTHVCAATSLLVWTTLDSVVFGKPSVIGAVQGMTTGLVCITPGAGLVQGWAAMIMGALSGSVPWYTMMIVHKKWSLLQKVDDAMGVFHTHGVAGLLGGLLTGLFAQPTLSNDFSSILGQRGAFYGQTAGIAQLGKQLVGALFIICWNVVSTSIICVCVQMIIPLRMPEDQLEVGDDAAHGEEAYALWGDGEKGEESTHSKYSPEERNALQLVHEYANHNMEAV